MAGFNTATVSVTSNPKGTETRKPWMVTALLYREADLAIFMHDIHEISNALQKLIMKDHGKGFSQKMILCITMWSVWDYKTDIVASCRVIVMNLNTVYTYFIVYIVYLIMSHSTQPSPHIWYVIEYGKHSWTGRKHTAIWVKDA